MSEYQANRIAVLESENEALRASLAAVERELADRARVEIERGPVCRNCRKPISMDGDGNWRDRNWLTWCGVGDSKHGKDW
jgi:hypothetical protein